MVNTDPMLNSIACQPYEGQRLSANSWLHVYMSENRDGMTIYLVWGWYVVRMPFHQSWGKYQENLSTALGIISLSNLSLTDRCDTRGKWPLARNPDRSWWYCHTCLQLFWPQTIAPWTTGDGPSAFANFYCTDQ